MIDLSTITKALEAQLKADPALKAINTKIVRGNYVNTHEDLCPWVGIYKDNGKYTPGSLGRHSSSFDGAIDFGILVQASHGNSGGECDELLESYVAKVLDAIWSDASIGGTVDMVAGFDVAYSFEKTKSETLYFQRATITLHTQLRTG